MQPYRPVPRASRLALPIRLQQTIVGLVLLMPLVIVTLASFEHVASAQTGPRLGVTSLTPYSVTVVVLSLVVGVITQAINTGKVAGQFQVPASWMVVLGIVAPFLGALTTTLVQAGALSSVSVFDAIVAGILAVTAGAAPGVAVHLALHAHLNVPRLAASFRKPPCNDNTQAAPAKVA